MFGALKRTAAAAAIALGFSASPEAAPTLEEPQQSSLAETAIDTFKTAAREVYTIGEQAVLDARSPTSAFKKAWEMASDTAQTEYNHLTENLMDTATQHYTLGKSALNIAWDAAQEFISGPAPAAPATDEPDIGTSVPASKRDFKL